MPGVWEFEVESRRTSPLLDNPFTLSATLQGVAVTPAVVELPSVTAGVADAADLEPDQPFGPVTVNGTGGPLGSARAGRKTIADRDDAVLHCGRAGRRHPARRSRSATPATRRPTWTCSSTSTASQVGQSADGDSEESVTLINPPAGTYAITIDGFAVPSGTTAVRLPRCVLLAGAGLDRPCPAR